MKRIYYLISLLLISGCNGNVNVDNKDFCGTYYFIDNSNNELDYIKIMVSEEKTLTMIGCDVLFELPYVYTYDYEFKNNNLLLSYNDVNQYYYDDINHIKIKNSKTLSVNGYNFVKSDVDIQEGNYSGVFYSAYDLKDTITIDTEQKIIKYVDYEYGGIYDYGYGNELYKYTFIYEYTIENGIISFYKEHSMYNEFNEMGECYFVLGSKNKNYLYEICFPDYNDYKSTPLIVYSLEKYNDLSIEEHCIVSGYENKDIYYDNVSHIQIYDTRWSWEYLENTKKIRINLEVKYYVLDASVNKTKYKICVSKKINSMGNRELIDEYLIEHLIENDKNGSYLMKVDIDCDDFDSGISIGFKNYNENF